MNQLMMNLNLSSLPIFSIITQQVKMPKIFWKVKYCYHQQTKNKIVYLAWEYISQLSLQVIPKVESIDIEQHTQWHSHATSIQLQATMYIYNCNTDVSIPFLINIYCKYFALYRRYTIQQLWS